jgi:hypothetical protein
MKIERLLLAALAVCLVIVLLVDRPSEAKRPTSVLRARAIELTDGRGQVRAEIKVESNREVVFRLRDQRGQIRVKIGASRAGSGLLLLNDATEPGVQALAGADNTSVTVQRGEARQSLAP